MKTDPLARSNGSILLFAWGDLTMLAQAELAKSSLCILGALNL